MMTLQTTASMAFFLLFVLIAVLNAFYLIMSVYTNKHYSRIPIVGLVFAILGFYFSPMYWHYWWLAIITDVGTLEFIIRGVPIIGRELWLHRRANIAYCFEGDDKAHNKHITFTLYRHGECHLKQEFKRAVGEVGLVQSTLVGTWLEQQTEIIVSLSQQTITLNKVTQNDELILQLQNHFIHPDHSECHLTDICLRQTSTRRHHA
jgi:hypothetical protein